MLQRLALKQFHGDEGTTFEFSDIVNGADVRMIERGCSARFAAESLDRQSVLGNIVRKEFQRDTPAEPRVFGLIDNAHSAAAEFFLNVVVGNRAASNGRIIRHRPWSVTQHLTAGKRSKCAKYTAKSRLVVRPQPVDATPPSAVIRQCFRRQNHLFDWTRSKTSRAAFRLVWP